MREVSKVGSVGFLHQNFAPETRTLAWPHKGLDRAQLLPRSIPAQPFFSHANAQRTAGLQASSVSDVYPRVLLSLSNSLQCSITYGSSDLFARHLSCAWNSDLSADVCWIQYLAQFGQVTRYRQRLSFPPTYYTKACAVLLSTAPPRTDSHLFSSDSLRAKGFSQTLGSSKPD